MTHKKKSRSPPVSWQLCIAGSTAAFLSKLSLRAALLGTPAFTSAAGGERIICIKEHVLLVDGHFVNAGQVFIVLSHRHHCHTIHLAAAAAAAAAAMVVAAAAAAAGAHPLQK
jgi:hypothetical protein